MIKNITNLDSLISGSKAPIRDLSMNKILMLDKLFGVVDQLVSGAAPITLANAANRAIKSLVQTGLCTQASTPTPSAPVPIKCNNGEIKWDSVNQRIYVDGTAEVLTVTDSDSNTQTASVANLFGIGASYLDKHDIISGTVERKSSIKALDGTEGWTISSNIFIARIDGMKKPSGNIVGISTHFKGTNATNANMPDNSIKITYSGSNGVVAIKSATYSTADDLADFLATQYAAGTPVIVVYPLATPYTEQVAAKHLNTAEGTNTVSVTAEVSPIALECKYKKNK